MSAIQISSIGQLAKIGVDPAYPLSGTYEQTNDIDASETSEWVGTWTPLGTFTGSYDGKGYAISDLYIDRNEGQLGLFRQIHDGSVKNLTLSIEIRSTSGLVGGLAYISQDSVFDNCHVNVIMYVFGTSTIGGFLGRTQGGVFRDCTTKVNIASPNAYSVGGFVGEVSNSFKQLGQTFTRCKVSGYIDASYRVGGFVGWNTATAEYRSCEVGRINITSYYNYHPHNNGIGGFVGVGTPLPSIYSRCSVASVVISTEFGVINLGGFAGDVPDAQFSDCYAAGGIEGSMQYGGVAGFCPSGPGASAVNCYSACQIQAGATNRNGFSKDFATVASCFYDRTLLTFQAGQGEPKVTPLMKALITYAQWDLDIIWKIDEGVDYPRHRYAYAEVVDVFVLPQSLLEYAFSVQGLSINVPLEYSDYPEDDVIRCEPAVGTLLNEGDPVSVYISLGAIPGWDIEGSLINLRREVVEQSGRYDLVAYKMQEGIRVPDYTKDMGVDKFINSAIKTLSHEVKIHSNMGYFDTIASHTVRGIRIPGFIHVPDYGITLDGADLIRIDQQEVKARLTRNTQHTGVPKYWFLLSNKTPIYPLYLFSGDHVPLPSPPANAIPISTIEELHEMEEDGYYYLTGSIDASRYLWESLPTFIGTLDGRGFEIRGLRFAAGSNGLWTTLSGAVQDIAVRGAVLSGDSEASVGIFCSIGSGMTCQRVKIYDSSVKGGMVGAIAGQVIGSDSFFKSVHASNCKLDCSYAAGAITALANPSAGHHVTLDYCSARRCSVAFKATTAGALLGGGIAVSMSRCWAVDNVVQGGPAAGGLVGSFAGFMVDCFATGKLYASNICGGLVGRGANGTIQNCYADATIILEPSTFGLQGGLVGEVSGGSTLDIINSYHTGGFFDLGKKITKEQLSTKASFVGWDFQNVWQMLDRPTLEVPEKPYDIGVYPIPNKNYTLAVSAWNHVPLLDLIDTNWWSENERKSVVDLACAEIDSSVLNADRRVLDATLERVKFNLVGRDILEEANHMGNAIG